MPRWGMARSAAQPGAAPAARACPPANLLRSPSGTKSGALETMVFWSAGGQRAARSMRRGKILARGRSPPAAAPHLRRRKKTRAPWFRWGCCDRGPVALRLGCGPAALCSAYLCGPLGICDCGETARDPGAAAAGPRRTQPRSVGRAAPNPPCRAISLSCAGRDSDAARASGARGRRRCGPRGSVARCSSRGRSHTSRRSRSSAAG